MSYPALIVLLPFNRLPNKIAPKVPNNITKNPHLFFALFSVVSLRPFIDKADS